RWEIAVENAYSLQLLYPFTLPPSDVELEHKLSIPPKNWKLEHNKLLATYLSENMDNGNTAYGNLKDYVESIAVSSMEEDKDALTDGNQSSYWESDGSQGCHWIRLRIKKGVIIKCLLVTVDPNDDNYMPHLIEVKGGDHDDMRKMAEVLMDCTKMSDVTILQDMAEYLPEIEIRIKECKDEGIDTRIHGIKIITSSDISSSLTIDLLKNKKIERFPLLANFNPEALYYRSMAILRFNELFDSVINLVIPDWSEECTNICNFKAVRQILQLSKRRLALIERLLRDSQTKCVPEPIPKVYLDRRLASEHKSDTSRDPTAENALFNQLYNELRPENCRFRLDYRWSIQYEQWWECKFVSEGIIDQGGGFRDSLADIAEELCPSAEDVQIPLPFFIRSCNQAHDAANIHRDGYIPNPACKEFTKYEWIGQLMGACFRSRECLVLSLPSFIWKKLTGEVVTWEDYSTVDEAIVRLLVALESMSEERFNNDYADALTYSTNLSDGSTVDLKSNGSETSVLYEDRLHYVQLVREARLHEVDDQIRSIKKGLLRVIPKAVLHILTWQELEKRICGNPEITVQELKNIARYEDIEVDDSRVKYFWKALENFSNEDRSRLLRFVTGRRRLPAPLFICPSRSGAAEDSLPESATCSSTLFLPEYTSPKVAEEKLLYAAYNCTSIDTDMRTWDD
ncbi:uncharacterized protein TRIADDRAFT_27944, partial [Trichoplax adhaerens]